MKIAPLAEVKDRLSAYLEGPRESAIVVTRNGKPVALLTSIREDDDTLLLTHDRRFTRLLEQARERVRAGRYLSGEQLWRELRRRPPRHAKRRTAGRSSKTPAGRPFADRGHADGACPPSSLGFLASGVPKSS